jgi:hypothetical protein
VARGGRHFANHYELAAHLLSQVSTANEEPVTESGLGRIDLLFELLIRIGLDTPDGLRPYLEVLHGDLERRPLAQQIIDALIAQDEARYETYLSVREDADLSRAEQARDEATYAEIGRFLTRWVELERLAWEIAPHPKPQRPGRMPMRRMLSSLSSLLPDVLRELDQLTQFRNQLVHGIEVPSAPYLAEATQRLTELIKGFEEYRDERR